MHRCLQIPEIIAMIVSWLTQCEPDLLALALTCHTFLEPCLDELWSKAEFKDLLRCFPSSVLNSIEAKGVDRKSLMASKSTWFAVCVLTYLWSFSGSRKYRGENIGIDSFSTLVV